jgi:hypothetical protein
MTLRASTASPARSPGDRSRETLKFGPSRMTPTPKPQGSDLIAELREALATGYPNTDGSVGPHTVSGRLLRATIAALTSREEEVANLREGISEAVEHHKLNPDLAGWAPGDIIDYLVADAEAQTLSLKAEVERLEDQHADGLHEIMAALYRVWPDAEDMPTGVEGICGLIDQIVDERKSAEAKVERLTEELSRIRKLDSRAFSNWQAERERRTAAKEAAESLTLSLRAENETLRHALEQIDGGFHYPDAASIARAALSQSTGDMK